ncbi:MAG: hypothetical protein MJ082_03455 [Clostridia bacterium]|nr:hypothetical protein [Clostridia bacterium]
MLMLCTDMGTTMSKVQVFNENGEIVFYDSKPTPLCEIDGEYYADIARIRSTVFELIRSASKVGKISSVAFSSFGESFVLLDGNGELLTYPMLYTDTRGQACAEAVSESIGIDTVFRLTGTVPHPMYSLYKALWIKENQPGLFAKAEKLCLICDYMGYLLTGRCVIDYSLASRTGAFDIRRKEFSREILDRTGIPASLFSEPCPAGTVVGTVLPDVAASLGLPADCRLILGSHDQICATLGAGVLSDGEAADGMGTVECITAVFSNPESSAEFGKMGYCVVPFPGDLYCTYILNFTCGSLVNWYRNEIVHGFTGEENSVFTYLERQKEPTDVLVLPYFAGCSTPYQDGNAKGVIANLTTVTTDAQIYRAILEGTSFEMKMNLEVVSEYGIHVRSVTATGGGANSAAWLSLKSDIFGIPVRTLRSSEGGLCGLGILSATALGLAADTSAARNIFVQYDKTFSPSDRFEGEYGKNYLKYKKLYKLMKEVN